MFIWLQAEEYVLDIGVTELPVVVTFSLGRPVRRSYTMSPLPAAPYPPSILRAAGTSACGGTGIDTATNNAIDSSMQKRAITGALSSALAVADGQAPYMLFISGDRSSVGKSTFSLLLLAALLDTVGFPASSVAYIKPVTQCEAEQPITKFCRQRGVDCQGIGPVVFYSGFTRAFLDENTKPSEELLQDACAAVKEIGIGKRLVLIDGVGYPAVGSICGISNADVAKALQAPVLLVGKSGVGDAVDSFNLNAR